MNTPHTLARPLAARVAALPDPVENEANPPLPPAVIERAAEALDAGRTHYTDRPGILPLRTQIVETLGSVYGLEMSADAVTITCDATEARFVVVKQLAEPGAHLLHAGSGAALAALAHLTETHLTEAVSDAVSIVYLTPNDDPARAAELCELAQARGWWVLWDTAGGMSGGWHPAQNPALAPQVISSGSFAAALPGWQVGWLAGSKVAGKLRAFKQSMTICTTSISQWAALGLEEQ